MRWLLLVVPMLAFADDLTLLTRIKVKMAENLNRLPNYTCSETVDRSVRLARARKPEPVDTVRLEVALVEGKEVYGWPGSNRIAESELATLVGGTIANGDFGLLARGIFLGSTTMFQAMGRTRLNGADTLRFDYRVPLLGSGYHIRVSQNEAVTGYHGSLWLHPETLDLLRLELIADDIPEYLGIASSSKILEYRRTVIGASDFLLPQSSELSMTDLAGNENRNRTRFHDCRQYAGESVLSFAEAPPEAKAVPRPLRDIVLPPDFAAEFSLLTPIDSDTAAVGDEIQGRLERNVRLGHKTLMPKGALLTGRILKLQRQQHWIHLVIAPQSLEFEEERANLNGRQNLVSLVTVPLDGASVRGLGRVRRDSPAAQDTILLETARLRLPRGMLLHLHSRLIESDKQ